MKKTVVFLIIFCISILVGCRRPAISSGEVSPVISTSTCTSDNSEQSIRHYTIPGESIIFWTRDGKVKAVTQDGEVFVIKDPFDFMTPGDCIKDIYIEQINNEPGYIVYNQYDIYSTLLPISSGRENAPEVFANYFFASKLYNGENDALSNYKINNITIKDGGNEHLIQFSINYDITPARYAMGFSWYNPYSTDYGSPNTVKGLTAEVILVGIDDMWMSIKSTLPKIDDFDTIRKPVSSFVSLEENKYILFESDGYTYYCQTKLVVESSEYTKVLTSVYSYNQNTGEVKTLLSDKEDQSFQFLDSTGDKIVLTSLFFPPEAETYDGPMYVIDKNKQEITEIDSLDTYAITDEGIYYAQNYNDPVLHFFNYKTGEITLFPEANVYLLDEEGLNYEFCYYDGKVLWTKGDKWYQLNQETKQVSEYVWK